MNFEQDEGQLYTEVVRGWGGDVHETLMTCMEIASWVFSVFVDRKFLCR